MATDTLAKASTSTQGLTKYNPERGLKHIAAAEAAEKHYARAKDASKLEHAIRGKLEAQAEFVLWWDQRGPGVNHGGPATRTKMTDRTSWPESLPDPKTVSRWRSRLNDPDKFEQTYTSIVARYRKLLEFEKGAHVEHNSGENEWYTPIQFIEAARSVMGGIDLDPATATAANEIVKAAEIFTEQNSGLTAERWDGRVWMNPPYAQPLIAQFCEKLADQVQKGHVTQACVLVNNATETQWFRALVDVASAVCFPSPGRVRFWSPGKESAAPLQGQAVIYIGESTDAFFAQFADLGWLTRIVRP